MTKKRALLLLCCSLIFLACGSGKEGYDPGPVPDLGNRQKSPEDEGTLTLKAEPLKLTHLTQPWKVNDVKQESGVEKYLRLQKKFTFPIQFNGWISLDNVEHNYLKCTRASDKQADFILEDDHNGYVVLKQGEKVPVTLEKLYVVSVEFSNDAVCKSVDIQFGVLYGTNE